MRGAASLRKKRQTLSLLPIRTQLVLCEKGKFSLDSSFSKNAPYKQKIILPLGNKSRNMGKNAPIWGQNRYMLIAVTQKNNVALNIYQLQYF